jgi:hypothetical protein
MNIHSIQRPSNEKASSSSKLTKISKCMNDDWEVFGFIVNSIALSISKVANVNTYFEPT